MAAERHNTANRFKGATESEFESMLRRHLQRGGALVAACTGFDADTASAYVEHALTAAAQARYEAHLAGCPSCRRHIIELARLLPTVTAPAPAPVWRPQWKEAVAEWFSRWQWDWRWAGTAAAATCALLIAVLGVQTLRRNAAPGEGPGDGMVAKVAQNAPAAAVSAPAATPMTFSSQIAEQAAQQNGTASVLPLPAESEQLGARRERQQSEAKELGVPAPAKPTSVVVGARAAFPAVPSAETFASRPLPALAEPQAPPAPAPTLIASERSSAPAGNPSLIQLPQSGQSQTGGPYSSQSSGFMIAVRQGSRQDAAPVIPPGEVLRKRVEAEILSEDLNLSAKAEAQDSKDAPKAERERSARSLKSALKGRPVFGLLPGRDHDEARTKEAETSKEESALKPLFKRVNGKTLFFEDGIWIDQAYKASAKLPLIRLARGSKEYQQTLIENPSLTHFFELGQVVVVWKGKVYEVWK